MKILIATNGRPSSQPALHQGALIAQTLGVVPDVLLVRERFDSDGGARLQQVVDQLAELDIATAVKERQGLAADWILREVASEGYDLLVMGSGHKAKLLERVFGDTTKKVLAAMPCTVLIAKGIIGEFRRVLVCDSLASKGGLVKAFLDHFGSLLAGQGQVTILHVMSQMGAGPSAKGWELRASAEELIDAHTIEGELITEDIGKFQGQTRVEAIAKVRHGLVVDEIVKETREGEYDLLVLGAHRGQGWEHFLLEDLAGEIVSTSRVPVLVLPRDLVLD